MRSCWAYGTVSTGFRSGGLNAVSEPFEPIPAAYSPGLVDQLRGGRQGAAVRRRCSTIRPTSTSFKWNNIQVQETTADGAFVYQGNAGTARVKGAEFEFTAHPFQYLSASFAGSYQDAYLTEGATAATKSTESDPGQ